jgi:hypothetical protein
MLAHSIGTAPLLQPGTLAATDNVALDLRKLGEAEHQP